VENRSTDSRVPAGNGEFELAIGVGIVTGRMPWRQSFQQDRDGLIGS
jgi:hypothetical protein